MGITPYTALVIQGNKNNIKCESIGPGLGGKHAGMISLYKKGNLHSPLLSTSEIYDDAESAEEAMQEIVDIILKADIKKEMEKIK